MGEYFSSVSEFHVVGNEEMNVGNEMGNEYIVHTSSKSKTSVQKISPKQCSLNTEEVPTIA